MWYVVGIGFWKFSATLLMACMEINLVRSTTSIKGLGLGGRASFRGSVARELFRFNLLLEIQRRKRWQVMRWCPRNWTREMKYTPLPILPLSCTRMAPILYIECPGCGLNMSYQGANKMSKRQMWTQSKINMFISCILTCGVYAYVDNNAKRIWVEEMT